MPEASVAGGGDDVIQRRRMFQHECAHLRLLARQSRRLNGISFGQHDLKGDSRLVEQFQHRTVRDFDLNPGIEQQQHAAQIRAAAQIVEHQPLPVALDGFRRLGIAIARHVHQHDRRCFHLEEIELAGAPGLVRHARQRLTPRQRIQQRGFAHIGAARKRDFRAARLRQMLQRLCGIEKLAMGGEELTPRLQLLRREAVRIKS